MKILRLLCAFLIPCSALHAQDNDALNNDVISNERFLENESFVVKDKIEINAAPEKVWAALTDPEMTEKYFFGCRVYSDWKPGSPISFKGKLMGKDIELKGKILKIEPQKLLQYTLVNSGGGEDEARGESLVTDQLSYANGVTTVTVSDNVGSGTDAEKRYKKSVKGWRKVLKGLKKVCEEK